MLLTAASLASRTSVYTGDSISALKTAMKKAQKVYDNDYATAAQVEKQVAALSAAILDLEEKTDGKLDINELQDGTYYLYGKMLKTDKKNASMSNEAIDHTITLKVKNGKYYLNMKFHGLTINSRKGYLSRLKYFTNTYTLNSYGVPKGAVKAVSVKFFAAVNTGSLSVGFRQLFSGLFIEYDPDVAAVYDLRFPRIFISLMAGAATAVSGVLFQAVLKNPLADPGIIGISSGAGFFAVCMVLLLPGWYFFAPMAAFAGGVTAFFLVYFLSWKGGLSPLRIILTGVAVDALFSGLSSIFGTISGGDRTGVASIVEANITQKTWDDVKMLLPYVIAGLFLALIFTGECNLLALEDKTARSLGIDVNKTRIVISLVAVLLASISTAVAVAVSFLGLIVPHIGRLLVGSDYEYCWRAFLYHTA